MVIQFSNIDFHERPILILRNAIGTSLGVLGYAKNISLDIKYNEISTIEFEVPEYADGEPTPFYEDIVGMRIISLPEVGQFTLVSPSEKSDGVSTVKSCKGYSLEYEFAYKKITLPEDTYKFWDEENPDGTLLGMIMELMPSWTVYSVPSSLQNRYRTFEVNNENLYNLIKSTVQESYNCIFDFDTIGRRVYVRDASDTPSEKPVFLSLDNLAKEIEITENTEDIFTRLDVNGAEGVTIRDVNPTGTNKLLNLDYYMTEDNFSSSLIEKYEKWKKACSDNREPYYVLSVRYAADVQRKTLEEAQLADLKGELTSLENLQAVAIEGIAQGVKVQADLDEANENIKSKKQEIESKESRIKEIQSGLDSIYDQMKAITEECKFENYFLDYEVEFMDRYIKDGEISESSFVVSEVSSYDDEGNGRSFESVFLQFSGSTTTYTTYSGGVMYDIRGGKIISETEELEADVISAVVDIRTGNGLVATVYLGSGKIGEKEFPSACISYSSSNYYAGDGFELRNGYRYFTLNASEYEKRSVEWELYEYGEDMLKKLSVPSYSFDVTSANFLALDEFIAFRDALTLGETIYLDLGKQGILHPIAVGVSFNFDSPESMKLEFSDSYSSGDNTFRLVDLLEQSVSMGKNVEASKYIYSSFVDSGASTSIKDFMTSALDVAKNAVMSSGEQAISWDAAGLRLRKYANEAHTDYNPEQIWMINNSIVMTADGWETAQMAIGKFHDENLGDCWGIVAPRIVGTLLAGSELVIESAKKEGGTSVFRVDGDGVRLYNGDLIISRRNNQIALNPDLGFAIGKYPLYEKDDSGNYTLKETNANFWVDSDGNLHFKGTLHGANGEFSGAIRATSLVIISDSSNKTIDEYIADNETVSGAVIEAAQASTAANSALEKANANASDIASLSQRVDEAELSVSPDQIKAAVKETLVVGGRNLYTGTRDFSGDDWKNLSYYTEDGTHQGCTVLKRSAAWGGLGQDYAAEVGEYTFSAWMKTDAAASITAYFGGSGDAAAVVSPSYSFGASEAWRRVSATFEVTTAGTICPRLENTVESSDFWVCGLKLEKGNVATDWSPAPEDSESELGALESRVSAAEVKITSDAIVSTVTSSESYKTLSNTASTAKSTADTAKTNAATAQSKADANESSITALTKRVSEAEVKIKPDAITATVKENIELGGRNLLLDTKAFGASGTANYTFGGTLTADAYGGFASRHGSSSASTTLVQYTKSDWQRGEDYMLSFWAKGSGFLGAVMTTYSAPCSSVVSNGQVGTDDGGSVKIPMPSEWTRYWIRFTMGDWDDATAGKTLIVTAEANSTAYICGLKLEKGSVATDWSAAPEDAADAVFVDSSYSKVEINKDKVRIVSTQMEVAVPSEDGEDDVMRVDADGVHAKVIEADDIISDSVVNVAPAASYTPADAGALAEILEELKGKHIDGEIYIYTQNVTGGDFEISNVSGSGLIQLSNTGTFNSLTIKNCSCVLNIYAKTFSTAGTAVTVSNSRRIRFASCTFNAGLGLEIGGAWKSDVHLNGCKGDCTKLASVSNGSILRIWGGSKPSGTCSVQNCGEIYNGTSDPTFAVASSSSIPTTTTAVVSLSPTSTSTSGHSGLGSKLYQGRYSSSQSFRKGIMLFTLPDDLTSADSIESATLTLKRIAGVGGGGSVTAQIRCYDATGTLYASKAVQNGQTVSIDVTSAVKAMKTNGYTGLMLYNPDTTTVGSKTYTTGYARFAGKGESGAPVLKVSYKK